MLDFLPTTKNVVVGQNFDVSIAVDTKGEKAAGVGAVILYDPDYLAIVSVAPGKLFNDYPEVSFDNTLGKAYISGIVLSEDQQITGYGIFADVTFIAKQNGTSKVNFDFSDGATNDSNIAVTHEPGDILSKVGILTVTATGTATVTDYPQSSLEEGAVELSGQTKSMSFVDKVLIRLGFKTNPYPAAPNMDPSQSQTTGVSGGQDVLAQGTINTVFILLLVIFVVSFLVYWLNKRIKSKRTSVYQDANKPPTDITSS